MGPGSMPTAPFGENVRHDVKRHPIQCDTPAVRQDEHVNQRGEFFFRTGNLIK